jgi:archaellum biogenesis ATPase FlaH
VFNQSTSNIENEKGERRQAAPMKFGVDFLDDATRGIYSDDLILIGAPSGAGKTQLCCNIATHNLAEGKRVHYIALEAARFEIERRLKYPIVLKHYYADPRRPQLGRVMFPEWLLGRYLDAMEPYEDAAEKEFESLYKNLYLYYKQDRFGLAELIAAVSYAAATTDLIMIDHVHYFDFDDDNENRAIKEIAKTVRSLAIEQNKPIILVAHLRKRDRGNEELISGLEEFHGSSDLYKIATKVVTVAPGPVTENGTYETYFRIPKNRLDGGVTRFSAKEYFDPKLGGYHRGLYEIGWSNQSRSKGFETIDHDLLPDWSRHKANTGRGGHGYFPEDGRGRLPFKD